ncbi:DUF4197 domain-containing protein [Thiohalophilus thiocyanatoxydans]|uniref:Uncharacterized protein DUF4197 n=1 Tax=Thiohalophilus thiocyanatoxydans TaxID=381308 RepID=A0A4R8J1J3_9GAMM|nr:DUF4197 domain-containing protein [Thiohalophilus thiocyanatoxydans]TDY04049.1 uncharacterized protein DUF4197 [Thiohalophilus thiocyanatoxydans]
MRAMGKLLSILLFSGLLTACSGDLFKQGEDMLNQNRPLTEDEIAAGLKEALKVGTERAVDQVGQQGGYYQDQAIHIPLPAKLQPVQDALVKVGLGHYLAELEQGMNRAAEVAAPKARALFVEAVQQMSWQDVKQIYDGPDDAATRYFQKTMTPELKRMMRPVIDDTLAQVGVVQTYDRVMDRYRAIPFAQELNFDLNDYVIQHGIDGMFYYLAKEEATIRQDPAKRTTEILQRVFGRKN